MEKNQNLNTKSELKEIVEAPFIKRIFAVIMDGAITLFMMFAMVAFIFLPIADKTMSYSEKVATQVNYQVASGLFICVDKDDEGNDIVLEIPDLGKASDDASYVLISEYPNQEDSFYINHAKYYFLNYKTGNNLYPTDGKAEDFRAPNYLELINGKFPVDLYTEEWFESQVTELKTKEKIMALAMEDLASQDYFISNNKAIESAQYFFILVPYFLSFFIFFILIPLLFKNGETLGKKVLHISLINYNSYSIKKSQVVFRQLFLLLYVSFFAFAYTFGATSFVFVGLGVFIYYLIGFINKKHRSLADFIAYTLAVDSIRSVWFKNKYVEENAEKELNEKVKEYKNVENINKNIIQIGSEIVDENLKKEIESNPSEDNLK